MNQLCSTNSTISPYELSVSGSLLLLVKHYKLILATSVGGILAGYAISFTLPVIYTAEARIMPPQGQQQMGLAGMMDQLPMMRSSGLGKDPTQLYIGLFKTTVVSNEIIKRFGLHALYGKKTLTETREALAANIIFNTSKDSLITINVNDRDPKRAANIANAYPEELNSLLQSLAITAAAQRRKFLESQLQQTKKQLVQAEISFKELQEQSGMLRLEDQGRVMIDAVSSIRAQIAAKQVEMQSLKIAATDANSAVKLIQAQLDALQAQLAQLEKSSDKQKTDRFSLNIDKLPLKGMEYIRRYRDLKFQETMYESIIKQYETARMEEARTSQIVQLADPAFIPELRSKPVRRQSAILFGFAGLFLSVIFIFIRNIIYNHQENKQL